MLGKYSSALDAALHTMSLDGWGNESSGDVECPTGYFTRISNSKDEIQEIIEAFADDMEGIDPEDLIGHFLIVEDNLGFVTVTEYSRESELLAAYADLEDEYCDWEDEGY